MPKKPGMFNVLVDFGAFAAQHLDLQKPCILQAGSCIFVPFFLFRMFQA
jgi:hypothetical protein